MKIRNQLLAMLLSLVLVVSLTACGDSDEKEESSRSNGRGPIVTEEETETGGETEEPTETAAPERVKMEATEIYKQIVKSVVQLNIYDSEGTWTSLGSGFYIDEDGLILTNYHVISGAASIEANDSAGKTYPVTEIVGYDEDLDIAFVRIDEKTTPVTLYRGELEVGETVYTLGSSEGFTGTFSDGIVSTVSRTVDGADCIQITAPISHGNSGGPLINAYGEVIGINSMFYTEGQNLNFAININETDKVDRSEPMSMEQFASASANSSADPSEQGYTIIYNEGDEGMNIYDYCDFIELEDNGSTATANELTNGSFMAAYVDPDDVDVFSFTVPYETEVYMAITPYWTEDDDYLVAGLMDEEGYLYQDDQGNDLYFTELDSDNEWFYIDINLPAGTYYIGAGLEDDYQYENGCYYEVGFYYLAEEQ